MTRPPLNATFEVLVSCSEWPEREFSTNIIYFSPILMKDLIKGNKNKV